MAVIVQVLVIGPRQAIPDNGGDERAPLVARLVLANAAPGSSKNIVPNLLIARSKRLCRRSSAS